MTYESRVRTFYDVASHCYEHFMGDRWHHGDPTAEARGLSFVDACKALEESLLAASQLTAGGWAMDFGSGIGGPTLHMASKVGARYVGVSNNDNVNQRARERASTLGFDTHVSFVTLSDTDYKHLPFPDATFDAVFFFDSVCHLPDKATFFKQVARLLKPGGRVAGTDWLQRPFGDNQSEAEVMRYMAPVNEHIRIPWHGTLDGYRAMMEHAGLEVLTCIDMFSGVKCWGSTPAEQRDEWLEYSGPEAELFVRGKKALDDARRAGVFTVGKFVAAKPARGRGA